LAKKGKADLLPNVHVVISLLKRWLLGTHEGAVRPKHLQRYLDEFTSALHTPLRFRVGSEIIKRGKPFDTEVHLQATWN
jgi:hypothetical protein